MVHWRCGRRLLGSCQLRRDGRAPREHRSGGRDRETGRVGRGRRVGREPEIQRESRSRHDAPRRGIPAARKLREVTVPESSATLLSTTLRLRVTNGSQVGPTVTAVGNGWTEAGLTFANRPAAISASLDVAGSLKSGQVLELDVTSAVTQGGTYSFRSTSSSRDGSDFQSREGAVPPELRLAME